MQQLQHSDDVRRPRALDTGAASAPYAAVYFKTATLMDSDEMIDEQSSE